jgi:sarcosine oxidase subunit delta
VRVRPCPDEPREAWVRYLYWRDNSDGVQKEWWYHRHGCRAWFFPERNAATNEVLRTRRAEPGAASEGGAA